MVVKWKWRETEEPFQVEMSEREYGEFCSARERIVAMLPGQARDEALDEVCALMELRALPAREISPEEMDAKGLEFELLGGSEVHRPLTEEAKTETLALMERMEAEGFRFPQAAKDAVRDGQTSFLAEPVRQPYRDADDDVEPVLADRAHARSSDPWTSHAAAKSIESHEMRETQLAVLDCLRRAGGLHHEGLVEAYGRMREDFGWPKQSVSGLRTRTSELVAAGMVRDSGQTVLLASNRASIVWEVAS